MAIFFLCLLVLLTGCEVGKTRVLVGNFKVEADLNTMAGAQSLEVTTHGDGEIPAVFVSASKDVDLSDVADLVREAAGAWTKSVMELRERPEPATPTP